jgi:hypothetical protein
MAYRGKYAGKTIVAPNAGRDLTYSPSGVQYPKDERSQAALLKPYGMITASEMGHIGGGIVKRLVGKGRVLEHLERLSREQHQLGEVSVFLLYIDPADGKLYYQQAKVDRERARGFQWQSVDENQTLHRIPSDTPTCRQAKTLTRQQMLAPLAKLDEQRIAAKKTRTTLLSRRFVPSRVVSKPRAS